MKWHAPFLALYRFGYAEFPSSKKAKKALEDLVSEELDGRVLRLDIATPRSDSSGTPSGRGTPRGGRGTSRGGGLTVGSVNQGDQIVNGGCWCGQNSTFFPSGLVSLCPEVILLCVACLGRGGSGPGPGPSNKLFISNLCYDTELNTLQEIFKEANDVYLPRNKETGEKRG